MRFGLQTGFFADLVTTRDVAQAAEALGFATIYFADHLLAEGPERHRDEQPAYDPMVQAALAADATRRIRVGHLVLCNPFRHPAVTARSLATLDELSGGRLVVGIGAGWTESEFSMTGLPFPDVTTRLRMLGEALVCLQGLWGEEPFTFMGEFYRLRDADLLPRPVQRPRPPILVGGSGRGLLRLGALHADAVNIVAATGRPGYASLALAGRLTDAAFRAKVDFLRAETRRAGRDPGAITLSQTIFNLVLTTSSTMTQEVAENVGGMLGMPPAEVLRSPLSLVGTPDDCILELRRREREWGVSETIVHYLGPDLLRQFAEQVLRHV